MDLVAKSMEKMILAIRLGTLSNFVTKIRLATSERTKLEIATEASRLADKVLAMTPKQAFTPEEFEQVQVNLEHYSLAVFCDHVDWADQSLETIRKLIEEPSAST